MIEISVNGKTIECKPGTTIAAAILNSGVDHFRDSVTGSDRGPLCGMGICFECRVTIKGRSQQRSCTTLVENEMQIETAEKENLTTDGHG